MNTKNCHRLMLLLPMLVACVAASALVIPAGTFYFDNSLTGYDAVKMVYGSDSRAETYVVSMTHESDNLWSITFDAAVPDMYRYTFAATTLPDGKITDTFSNVKNDISNNRGEYRTATTSADIVVGGVFTPTSGDNWAQGSWKLPTVSEVGYSGTLPVLYINTDDGNDITSRDEYVTATYYIDNLGLVGYESIGSADAPLALQVRGRGNYTWTGFNKKPYRLKFDAKAKPLGMNSSRHFVLLASADDELVFLRNTVGFELSHRLGLSYTPDQQPVEVVINGDYKGMYLLAENIRVAKDRVNIFEMDDEATDDVTGGWIVEIDNYDDPAQVKITEGNGATLRVTYHSPEVLSTEQEQYLINQMSAINNAVYVSDKTSQQWEQLVDLETLARFYIVQEIMDDAESFHGSCYMHKDRGDEAKWMFGPVWDFGNAMRRSSDKFIYTNPPFGQTWIGEMAKFERFQNMVTALWRQFLGSEYDSLNAFIDEFMGKIAVAAQYDAQRWPEYGAANPYERCNQFKQMLQAKVDWLITQWGEADALPGVDAHAAVVVWSRGNEVAVTSDAVISRVTVWGIDGMRVAQATPGAEVCSLQCPLGVYVVEVTLANGTRHVEKVAITAAR
ncbi:MAG: CotH kinase family protein [Muribaculaceae bacterium]